MAPPLPDGRRPNLTYQEAVDRIAESYGVPKSVYSHMLGQESGDKDSAESPKGAETAWQIMPDTARALGSTPEAIKKDPLLAAQLGLKYLSDNYKKTRPLARNDKHGWMTAVASYHAGPGRVVDDLKRGGYGLLPISDGGITNKDHVLQVFKNVDSSTLDRDPFKPGVQRTASLPTPGYGPVEPVQFTGGEPTPLQKATPENVAALYSSGARTAGQVNPLAWLNGTTPPVTPLPANDIVAQATYGQILKAYGLPDTEELRTGYMLRYNAMKLGQASRVMTSEEDKFLQARKTPTLVKAGTDQAVANATGQAEPQKLNLGGGAYMQSDDQAGVPAGQVRMVDKEGRKFFAIKDATAAPQTPGQESWNLRQELPEWATGRTHPKSKLPADPVLQKSYETMREGYRLPDSEELRQKFLTGYKKIQAGTATEIFDPADKLLLNDLKAEIDANPEKYAAKQVALHHRAPQPIRKVKSEEFERTGEITTQGGQKLRYSPDREGLKEGEYRFVDDQGETFIANPGTKEIKDETLAEEAKSFDIELLPESERGRTTPEMAKRAIAGQIAQRLLIDATDANLGDIPPSDTAAFFEQEGYKKLASGKEFSPEDYFAKGDKRTEPFSLTRRDIKDLEEFSTKRRAALEDWTIGVIASGREFTAAERQQLTENDVDMKELEGRRRDDVLLALEKRDVAKKDFERYLSEFESTEHDSYIAKLKANAKVGWISKAAATGEIAAYKALRAEKRQELAGVSTDALEGIGAIKAGGLEPPTPAQIQRDTESYTKAVLGRYGSVTARNRAIDMEKAQAQARADKVAQMSWGEYLVSAAADAPLRIVKSAISVGIAGTWKGIALGAKGLDTMLGVRKGEKVSDYESWKIGQGVDDWLDKLPMDERLQEDFWAGSIPQGLGSTLGMMVGGESRFPKISIGFLSALQQGGGAYEEAIKDGATEEQAQMAGWLNMPFGATEVVGMGDAIMRLNKGVGKTVWREMVRQAIHEGSKESVEEILQEGTQTVAGNVIARMTYDPDRQGDKDLVKSMASAGISASLFSAGVTFLNGMRNRKAIQREIDAQMAAGPMVKDLGQITILGKPIEENATTAPHIQKYRETKSQIEKIQRSIEDLQEEVGKKKNLSQKRPLIKEIWEMKARVKRLQEEQKQATQGIIDTSEVKLPKTTVGETILPVNPTVAEDTDPVAQEAIRARTFDERLPVKAPDEGGPKKAEKPSKINETLAEGGGTKTASNEGQKPAQVHGETVENGVAYVDKARLEISTWSHERNRDVGGGDIGNAYSGDTIPKGKIRKPFSYGGKLYTNTGGSMGYSLEGQEIVPLADWTGNAPITYNEATGIKPFSYTGIGVRHGGKDYVITGNKVQFSAGERSATTAEPPAKPAPAVAKAGDRISDDYHVRMSDGSFEEVHNAEPIELPGYEEGDFFIHTEGRHISIYEGRTGTVLGSATKGPKAKNGLLATRNATKAALTTLNGHKDALAQTKKIAERMGTSPRYGGAVGGKYAADDKATALQSAKAEPTTKAKSVEEIYAKPKAHLSDLLNAPDTIAEQFDDKIAALENEIKPLLTKKKATRKRDEKKLIQDQIDIRQTHIAEYRNQKDSDISEWFDSLWETVKERAKTLGYEFTDDNEEGGFDSILDQLTDGRYMENVYNSMSVQEYTDALLKEFFEKGEIEDGAMPPVADPAHDAATSPKNDLDEPTDAQKEAGNFQMGHIDVGGLDVTIEQPAGSTRSGKNKAGKEWSYDMTMHYGYIKRTVGADGEHVDVFVKPDTDFLGYAYIIDQIHPDTGKFDEHKVMLRFKNEAEARAAYLSNYPDDWKGLGGITTMSMPDFKAWLEYGDMKKPAALKGTGADLIKDFHGAINTDAITPDNIDQISAALQPKNAEGLPIYTTPGTKIEWSDVSEWLNGLRTVQGRHLSTLRHTQEANHWGMLAAEGSSIIATATEKQLRLLRDKVDAERGAAGTDGKKAFAPIYDAISKRENELGKAAAGNKPADKEIITTVERAKELIAEGYDRFSRGPAGRQTVTFLTWPDYGKRVRIADDILADVQALIPNPPGTNEGLRKPKSDVPPALQEIADKSPNVVIGKPAPIEKPAEPDVFDEEFAKLFGDEELSNIQKAKAEATSAIQNTKAGLEDAGKALLTMFDPKKFKTMGIPSFDEATYQQARPMFIQAIAHFKMAGQDTRAAINSMIRYLKEEMGGTAETIYNMRPYVLRFSKELAEGAITFPEPITDEAPSVQDEAPKTETEPITAQEDENVSDPGRVDDDSQTGDGSESSGDVQGTDGVGDVGTGSDEQGEGGDTGTGPDDIVENGGTGNVEEASDAESAGDDVTEPEGERDSDSTGDRIPDVVKHDFIAAEGTLTREGNWKDAAMRNLDAIELVKKLETEGRLATPEEQLILSKFIGWGSTDLAQKAFPGTTDGTGEIRPEYAQAGWKEVAQRVQDLLTAVELKAALRSTQYAHYTSEKIIRGIWSAIRQFGFKSGKILEPGMGTGLFVSAAPTDVIEHSKYTGIEMDPMTARISKQLFQRQAILEADFVKQKLPNNFFDVAVGNPPYASIRIEDDPEYKKHRFVPHDYFFAKSIDKVRPGGILVFVTSKGTMDKKKGKFREHMSGKADLLGAIRLPQTAFKQNAGTDVVTDVLFFRKRAEGEEPAGEPWTELKSVDLKGKEGYRELDYEYFTNEYYVAHPEMILGKPSMNGKMKFRNAYTVEHIEGSDIEADFLKAVENLPNAVYAKLQQTEQTIKETSERDWDPKTKKEGGLYVHDDGRLMRREFGSGVKLSDSEKVSVSQDKWLRGYIKLRDTLKQAQFDQLHADDTGDQIGKANVNRAVRKLEAFIKSQYGGDHANALAAFSGDDDEKLKRLQTGAKYLDIPIHDYAAAIRLVLDIDLGHLAPAPAVEPVDWRKSLQALFDEYEAFVGKHGFLLAYTTQERTVVDDDGIEVVKVSKRFKNQKLLQFDVEAPLVEALERINEDGEIRKYGLIGNGIERTVKKPAVVEIKTLSDALAVSLDKLGTLNLVHVAELMQKIEPGFTKERVIADLGENVYEEPGGTWLMADEYLSGLVLDKLAAAKAAAASDVRYQRNVDALEKVQPVPLLPAQIQVGLGSAWVGPQVVTDFSQNELNLRGTISFDAPANHWSVEHAEGAGSQSFRRASETWGTEHRSPYELLDAALNNKTVKVMTERTRTEPPRVDPIATAAANDKMKAIREAFKSWIWSDAERAKELSGVYNTKFNNIAPRAFNGSHLTLPGLSAVYKLHAHQLRAVWRIVQTGNTYLAHAVGAGKTLEMIVSGKEQKRLGLINKPMYAVPRHMLKQFSGEYLEAYPLANILVADENQFAKENRKRFVAQAALNDLDAIIVPHTAFGLIRTRQETSDIVVDEMIQQMRDRIDELGGIVYDVSREKWVPVTSDRAEQRTVKKLQARIETIERRFQSRSQDERRDDVVDFEDLGVDFLYVDEAHEFRKLDFVTNRDTMKGITPDGSRRALDLLIKQRWLDSQRPGRSGVFASGTPVTNTLAELYSIQRFLDPQGLEDTGLSHFDAWSAQFGEVVSDYEMNAAGKYEIVERFARFVNIPELMKRIRQFMDVLTLPELAGLVDLPTTKGGQPEVVVVPANERQEAYLRGELADRIKQSKDWKPSQDQPFNPDPLINIITDARLAAIDMRFVDSYPGADPEETNDESSKLNKMIDDMIADYHKFNNEVYVDREIGEPDPIKGASHIIFAFMGFGEAVAQNRHFDARAWLIKRAVRGGIPANEIAFITDYKTAASKEALFQDIRQGVKKILIGSPMNMGTGVNVQKRLKTLKMLSPPWFPAHVEQPDGRIVRQGNQNEEVERKRYATKGTYDSTGWQMVARKSKAIESAMSGDDSLRSLEDLSESSTYAQASAMAAGDERAIQLVGLAGDIERLRRLRDAHAREQYTLDSNKRHLEISIKEHQERIERFQKVIDKVPEVPRADLMITIDGKTTAAKQDDFTIKANEVGEALKTKWRQAVKQYKDQVMAASGFTDVDIATVNHGVKVRLSMYALLYSVHANASISKRLSLVFPEDVKADITDGIQDASFDDIGAGGLTTRLLNGLNGAPERQAASQEWIDKHKRELKQVESKIGQPFAGEQEMYEKIAEHARLQAEMAAGDGSGAPPPSVLEHEAAFYRALKPIAQSAMMAAINRQKGGIPVFTKVPVYHVRNAEDHDRLVELRNTGDLGAILPGVSSVDHKTYLEVSPEAVELIMSAYDDAVAKVTKDAPPQPAVDGTFLEPDQTDMIVKGLNHLTDLAQERGYADQLDGTRALIQNIKKMARRYKGSVALAVFKDTVPHEKTHQAEFVGAAGKERIDRYYDAQQFADDPDFNMVWESLNNLLGHEIDLGTALSESLAYLATGEIKMLGFTGDDAKERAVDLLVKLIKSYEKANGPEAIKNFNETGARLLLETLEQEGYDLNKKQKRAKGKKDITGDQGESDEPPNEGGEPAPKQSKGPKKGGVKSPDEGRGEGDDEGAHFRRFPETLKGLGYDVESMEYEPTPHAVTEAKAELKEAWMGVADAVTQALLDTTVSEGSLRVLTRDIERKERLIEKLQNEGRDDEASAVRAEQTAIYSRTATNLTNLGRAIESVKMMMPLSAEAAKLAATRLKQDVTGDPEAGLTDEESKAIEDLTKENPELRRKLAEAEEELEKLRPTQIELTNAQRVIDRLLKKLDEKKKSGGRKPGSKLYTREEKKIQEAIAVNFEGSLERLQRLLRGAKEPTHNVAQRGTPAFKEWFKNSKVIDENGEPLVVYHLTPKDFATLKPGGDDVRKSGAAIWLTPDSQNYKAAHNVERRAGEAGIGKYRMGTQTIPAYVNITRPLVVDDTTREWATALYGKDFPQLMSEETVAELKNHGYDGVLYHSRADVASSGRVFTPSKLAEVIAFDSNQVKSAIGNQGTFGPSGELLKSISKPTEGEMDDLITVGANVLFKGLKEHESYGKDEFFADMMTVLGSKQVLPYMDQIHAKSQIRLEQMRRLVAQRVLRDRYRKIEGNEELSNEEIDAIAAADRADRKAKMKVRGEHAKAAREFEAPQREFERNQKLVEKIQDLTDEEEIAYAAVLLRTTKGKSINSVLTAIQDQYNVSPDEALHIAQQAKALLRSMDETTKTPAQKAAEAVIDDLQIQMRKKEVQLSQFLSQLVRPQNLRQRISNAFRAMVVLNHGTQLFNVIQSTSNFIPQQVFMDLVNTAISRGIGKEQGEIPAVRFRDAFLAYSYMAANNKSVADGLLARFPEIYFQVKKGLMTDIELERSHAVNPGRNAVTKFMHQQLNKQDKLAMWLSKVTFAKAQEEWMRDAMVVATLDQIVRAKHGRTLADVLEKGHQDIITESQMQEAADRALTVTAAAPIDDPVGKAFKGASDWIDKHLTIFLNPVWFARFTYTITKAVANSLAFGALDATKNFGKGEYTTKSFAKGVMGWGAVGFSYLLLSLFGGDDDKWYSLYLFGKDNPPVDARRWFPMSAYLFTAHVLRTMINGRKLPGAKDWLEGLASFESDQYGKSPISEFVQTALGLKDMAEDSGYSSLAAREVGVVLSSYLRFFAPFKTIFSAIDKDEAAFRKYGANPSDQFIKEMAKSLPIQHLYGAPKRTDPVTGRVLAQPYPLLKLVGLNLMEPGFLKPDKTAALEKAMDKFPSAHKDEPMTQAELDAYSFRNTLEQDVRTDKMTPAEMDKVIDGYVKEGKISDDSGDYVKLVMRFSKLQDVLRRNFQVNDPGDVKALGEVMKKATPEEIYQIRNILLYKQERVGGKVAERVESRAKYESILQAMSETYGRFKGGAFTESESVLMQADGAKAALRAFEQAPEAEKPYLTRVLQKKKKDLDDNGKIEIQEAINAFNKKQK